jgi:N-acetylmuramoyl-L-alanine amidase
LGCGGCALTPERRHERRRVSIGLAVVCLLAALSAQSRPALAQGTGSAAAVYPVTPQRLNAARFVVVLDAAHGGDDGGGQVGSSIAEKTVTLALSVRLRSLLTARGFQVVTTREGNVNLDSDARAQIANHAALGAGSAACLSFHASQSGSGVHLFVSSLAPGSSVRFPAWKTAQSAYVARSLKLAGELNAAFEHSGDAATASGGDTSTGPVAATLARASLPGLDSMACPAVAIEVAPVRAADRTIVTDVTDDQYQTRIVEALAAALLEWKTDWETDPARAGGRQP